MEIPRVDTALHGVETPTPWACCCLVGAHGASARRQLPLGPTLRSRRTRGDRVSSSDLNSFHTSTTPIIRRRKQKSPVSILPCTVCEPQPHWLVAHWPGLMEPARGESFPPGQRRGPAAPEEDSVLPPDHKSFHTSKINSNNLGT